MTAWWELFRPGALRAYKAELDERNDQIDVYYDELEKLADQQATPSPERYDPPMAKTVEVDHSKDGRARFSVDGEPFPWWVSEEGPSFKKLATDLYLVKVRIIATHTPMDDLAEGFSHGGLPSGEDWPQPVILGIEFPWLISEDGFIYRSQGCKDIPTVELGFFTESVEGVSRIEGDGKVFDANGYCRRVLLGDSIRYSGRPA